jgi:hypothetical protein
MTTYTYLELNTTGWDAQVLAWRIYYLITIHPELSMLPKEVSLYFENELPIDKKALLDTFMATEKTTAGILPKGAEKFDITWNLPQMILDIETAIGKKVMYLGTTQNKITTASFISFIPLTTKDKNDIKGILSSFWKYGTT